MALHGFAEGCLGIPGGEKPSGRMRIEAAQLLKKWYTLFYKSKVIANQVRAYSSSPLKFGADQLNVRTSTYERVRARTVIDDCT